MTQHKALWTVSLSNGETIYEGKGEYQSIENEASPWQRLLKYIFEKKLSITSIGLYSKNGKHWNLPGAGSKPRFQAFSVAMKPFDFNFFRVIGADLTEPYSLPVGDQEHFSVIESLFEGFSVQLWVNEKNTNVSWVAIKRM